MNEKVAKMVTDRILATMADGVIPWTKPWRVCGVRPQNMVHRKPYRGINAWLTAGFPSPYWLTFKQVNELGGKVRKGEHGTPIVFWTFITPKEKKDDPKAKKIPFLRYYLVWNLSQTEGIPDEKVPAIPAFEPLVDDGTGTKAAELFDQYLDHGPAFVEGGDVACYSSTTDTITLPKYEAFTDVTGYWGTAFHEAAHSTGHASRLDRDIRLSFGSKEYAREELVAEIASAFLQMEAGLEPEIKNAAAYIQGWMTACETDPMLFVTAAGRAEKAVDWILGAHAGTEDEFVCEAEAAS